MNNKREIRGWAMYDWANSAFSTTVGTVFLGPYLAGLARAAAESQPDKLARFFGLPIAPDSFLPYCISFSVALQAGLLPILGALGDFSNRRKQLMRLFATIGAIATALMFFVEGALWPLGGLLFMVANLAFGASIVFYNAYLPEIATEDKRDSVSSFGWAMGYLGGGLLLLLNLAVFILASLGALPISTGMAVRINLGSAGLWWLLWALFTWSALRDRAVAKPMPAGTNLLNVAFDQLAHTMEAPPNMVRNLMLTPLLAFALFPVIVIAGLPIELVFLAALGPIFMIGYFIWRKQRSLRETANFLLAYLIYNDGIQTVIGAAAVFAAAPVANGGMGMPTIRLTLLILMIQFVAFVGALFFGRLAGWLGSKRALVISLVIWSGAVIAAYVALRDLSIVANPGEALGGPMTGQEAQFWALGAVIALVLGGSQALSRSIFSQMVPKSKEAEFFSIYEISERGTSWLGPFVFGFVNQMVGNLRPAILSVVLFFVAGLLLLWRVNIKRAAEEARMAEIGEAQKTG